MKYDNENNVLDKDYVTLVQNRDAHLQTDGTNPEYCHPVPGRNSQMMLTSPDDLVSVKGLMMSG